MPSLSQARRQTVERVCVRRPRFGFGREPMVPGVPGLELAGRRSADGSLLAVERKGAGMDGAHGRTGEDVRRLNVRSTDERV